ncbi:hypothetical protein K3148_02210 [Qipengyuania aurantiaca]|uniref:Uncharacterized protein n=1 Tax=Qipengyuania aurantiaca TaxID=2867233 RepID=A0ABX8ZNF0_9SPHN|nr:hypothetical protein [Qipengyuania aurantiaca]QZD90241.1 hypothetical protein K3148_02210 [Qipengyuania aurantiaca]
MKTTALRTLGLALAVSVVASPAQAGPFDKLRKKAQEIEKAADDAKTAAEAAETVVDAAKRGARPGATTSLGSPLSGVRAVDGSVPGGRNNPKTAGSGNYAGRAPAAPAKYASLTKCANLNIGNAFVAQTGDYTFQQGLSTETRGGLIDREPVSLDGCTAPGMGVGDVLYVEVDAAKYDKHRYALQCVAFDGSQQLDNVNAPRENNYTGKDVMLHTGNSLGYEPTASGSNSDRSGAYDAYLAKRGRAMITFNMPGLHTDKSGTDFYCQHYDKATGKSALAFTYRRGPVDRQGRR